MYRALSPRKFYGVHVSSCNIASVSVPVTDLQTMLDAGITPQQSPLLHATRDEFDNSVMKAFDDVSAVNQQVQNVPQNEPQTIVTPPTNNE